MGLLGKKRGEDVIDFTRYHKNITKSQSFDEDKVIDLGKIKSSEAKPETNTDFISDLAGFGSIQNTQESSYQNIKTGNQEVNELRIKLEDNEYKINLLVNRVNELERKLREKS